MKRTHNILPILSVVLLAAWATPATATPASPIEANGSHLSALLEQAIFTEESLGDLRAAIDLYQEIVAQAQAERSFAAQAQLRLAVCYQKMGQEDEAVAALRQLVKDFPSQAELVAEARARLSELGIEPHRPGVSLRQVWADALELNGEPSPDGRYLTFTDWSTGDLALRDLETGKNRQLTRKGSWATDHYAEHSIFSPDGKQVAYSWWAGEAFYELRVIGVGGSASRLVYAREETWVQPLDWTSDGKQILAWIARKGEADQQLALISVDSGEAHVVGRTQYPDWSPRKVVLTPDDRHVVFARLQAEGSAKYDIYMRSMADGAEVALVEHDGDDQLLGWSPNGSELLFASDRTGEWGAWVQRIVEGKAAGQPELVKSGLGDLVGQISPMGFTREGTYFYGLSTEMTDVYLAALDGGTPPSRVTQRFVGANSHPDWSADGQHLAWLTQHEGTSTVVIRELDTGEEQEVPIAPELVRIGKQHGLGWSPDGSRFVVAGALPSGEGGWWGAITIDAVTGAVQRIAPRCFRNSMWAPDGKSLYCEHRRADGSGEILAVDPATGEERVVHRGHVGTMAVSPDGSWLAFTTDHFHGDDEHSLTLVPTAGGETRELLRSDAPFFSRTPLAWMPDGRSLIFGTGDTELDEPFTASSARFELWKISVEGGEPEKLPISMPHLAHLRVHPDGKRVVFDAGRRTAEIWALENFLPGVVASR